MPTHEASHDPSHTFPVDQIVTRIDSTDMPNKEDLLNLQFIEMRHLVVEIAAFLDRIDRCPGPDDFRAQALRKAITHLSESGPHRAKAVLDSLSDPSTEATNTKAGPPACGAPRLLSSNLH